MQTASLYFQGMYRVELTHQGKQAFKRQSGRIQRTNRKHKEEYTPALLCYKAFDCALSQVVKDLGLQQKAIQRTSGGKWTDNNNSRVETSLLNASTVVDPDDDIKPSQSFSAFMTLWFKDDPGNKEKVAAALEDGLRDKLRETGARIGTNLSRFFEITYQENPVDPG